MRAGVLLLIPFMSATAAEPDFRYHSPGKFVAGQLGTPRAGDRTLYAPDIAFPLRFDAARGERIVANSQVYAARPQCSAVNHAMPWGDTFCEKRHWNMPMCPSGQGPGRGHQGIDIRPVRCVDNETVAVAVEDGVVRKVTPYTNVEIRGDSGMTWRYLHMHPQSIALKAGDRVRQGDPVGRVSDHMETPHNTSLHLHLDAQGTVVIDGNPRRVFLPLYASLVDAYRKALGLSSLDTNGQLGHDSARELP